MEPTLQLEKVYILDLSSWNFISYFHLYQMEGSEIKMTFILLLR